MKKYIEKPEWADDYPAIDGIAKSPKGGGPTFRMHFEKPIRSDIEKLLKLGDSDFEFWYIKCKIDLESRLKEYKIITNVPDLKKPEENFYEDDEPNHIEILKKECEKRLNYLEKIKEIRKEYWEKGLIE